jgi:hypothetical protein
MERVVRLLPGIASGLAPPPQPVEHRQAIIVASYGLAIDQARRSLERERGARDQWEAAGQCPDPTPQKCAAEIVI